jgi:peptidoglycan hydrolase-like protein with peptidoglycan-binding domain
MLKELGFYSGSIDNDFTPELVDAVTIFQGTHGLQPADGIFGSLTYQKMAGLLDL